MVYNKSNAARIFYALARAGITDHEGLLAHMKGNSDAYSFPYQVTINHIGVVGQSILQDVAMQYLEDNPSTEIIEPLPETAIAVQSVITCPHCGKKYLWINRDDRKDDKDL